MHSLNYKKNLNAEELFYRDALRQIPRLVYVAASADGYVVGEELEGDYF